MLMITSFANPRVAQAFVDYMATQGVILTIQQHNQSDVWLADESQAERVRAELARFLENPADPRYLAASWQAGHTGSGLHYRRYPFFAALRERAGPVTWVMMISRFNNITKAMSGWRMSPRPSAYGRSWRVFSKTRQIRVIWRRAGRQAIPAVACIIAVILSLPPCVNAQVR